MVGFPDHDEVGSVGNDSSRQGEGRIEHDMVHRHARGHQSGFRLGERWRDQCRQARPQVWEHAEPLGAAREENHLVLPTTVPERNGPGCPSNVVGARVVTEVGQPRGETIDQPGGRLRRAHVHGEVEHAGARRPDHRGSGRRPVADPHHE